jgi:hypothetical protein
MRMQNPAELAAWLGGAVMLGLCVGDPLPSDTWFNVAARFWKVTKRTRSSGRMACVIEVCKPFQSLLRCAALFPQQLARRLGARIRRVRPCTCAGARKPIVERRHAHGKRMSTKR